ncbi:MAG TPA: polysaccharide deacetylase family protein [Rhodothermales bacterium]|nr:polysaccharide deacetylase family protein [Rhodothermales bacterium]
MRRLLIAAAVLLSAPVLLAQSPGGEGGFVPGPGFRPTAPATAYSCSTGTLGADSRCASTDIPGGMAASQAPQFMLITFDDCMTTETEALIRSVLTPDLRNPDGRPIPSTYFLSLEGCPGSGGESEQAIVKQRYRAGDEIAIHTRTHTTGTTTTYAKWIEEISYVKGYLEWLGLGPDAGRGFRAPFLATNKAMYQALDDLGFLYDSSVYESPFYSPISDGIDKFIWPFTYDTWSASAPAQLCAGWTYNNTCPGQAHAGLWQVPLYYYVAGTESNPTYYGTMDIGDPAYSGYSQILLGTTLKNIFQTHLNARLTGSRAPLTLYFHAHNFGHTQRAGAYRQFIASTLARGDVWAVTMQGLLEWMKAPVPNSQMKSWYASYCQRHPCSSTSGTGTAADEAVAANLNASLRAFPSPTRGTLTLETETVSADATVTVTDVLGREVHRATVPGTGFLRQPLDLSREAPGMYFVRLDDGTRTSLRTVVVQR